jgi:F0F1-type ATP synthase assembly protein I
MKSPRLFRPMFTLGIIVAFGAVISYLMVPGLRSNPAGLVILLVLLLIGIAAIVLDLVNLGKEMQAIQAENKKNPPDDAGEDGSSDI